MQTKEAVNLFLNSRRAKGLSPETIRWYREILGVFTSQFPELPHSPEDIEDFLSSCKAGDERRHGYYRAVRALYRFLDRRLDIPNPVTKVDPPKRKPKFPKPITPDELDQLLAFPHPPKVKAALLFLADTGARVGELANLKPEDLYETPWGHVARITGKTGQRIVPISFETYQALMKVLPFGYSKWWLRQLISRAFKDARVPGTAHTLRHTFGTLWEGDELVLQQIMGHTHLSTTRMYRHLRTKLLSRQHHQYSPLKMVFATTKNML